MSLLASIAVYVVIWWVVLFCVLPLNIQSQFEKGEFARGTEPGAPVAPQILRKAVLTSILSLAVFAVVYVLWVWADI